MSKNTVHIILFIFLVSLVCPDAKGSLQCLPGRNLPDSLADPGIQLKILSWNIGMLPLADLFKEKDGRPEAIASALYHCHEYDIIVFEEAFTQGARAVIAKKLRGLYPFAYGPVNGHRLSMRVSSGIWILSKIPLEIRKEIEFTESAGFDAFARKGAVLLEGQFRNSVFQLIATHLQDDEYPQSIRECQLRQIYNELLLPYSDPLTPQIICGDFNTDEKVAVNYLGMLSILNAEDGEISGQLKVSFDDESNDAFRSPHPDPRRIDYMLTRNGNLIRHISRDITVLRSGWGDGKQYLSDHNAIEAEVLFSNRDYLTRAGGK